MTLFSKRYQGAIRDKRIAVPTVPVRTRTRIWMLMAQFTDSWQEVDDSNWSSWTNTQEKTELCLKREYGEPQLIAYIGEGNQRGPVNFETFLQRCYPSQVLDAVEAFCAEINDPQGENDAFTRGVNRILSEEGQPWRMSGGELFKVDSEFLDVEVLARTEELLSANGYMGALDEFREARNDLAAGETREAIAKAHAAFESTMKTILGVHDGNASTLVRTLVRSGFFDDLPANTKPSALGDQVLMSVAFMGNSLGRHGQGEDVLDVPRHYAQLALHLSGSLIRMLVERQLELSPPAVKAATTAPPNEAEPEFPSDGADDIPF